MTRACSWITTCTAISLLAMSLGCEEQPKPEAAKPPASATAAPAPKPTPAPAPTPSAPKVDCPEGSTGEGGYDKPCEASGAERMMKVTWTGKMDDKGPSFRVVNESSSVILYGKMMVYFYDKAGKQLEVKSSKDPSAKPNPYLVCSGNMFGGVMNPKEKAVITFSCVKTKHVPEGTKAIEAEMQTVGFADESEKHCSYYWQNRDLVPEERPKGGVKAKKSANKGKK